MIQKNKYVPTEEHKQKMREGLSNYNKTRILSEETKEKMSLSAKKAAAERIVPLPNGMKKRNEHTFIDGIECKHCTLCNNDLPITNFGKSNGKWDGLTYECKPCRNSRLKEKYRSSKEDKDTANNYAINRRRGAKIRAVEYKGNKCSKCSLEHVPGYNSSVFQFHHRNPGEKDFAVSSINMRSFANIIPELDKCDLLCANCHHIVHWEIKNKK